MATARYYKVKIGEHELNAETLMLGYGYDPSLSEGSVKPPVFLTSTFVFQTAEQGRDFFDYMAGRRPPPVDLQPGLVPSSIRIRAGCWRVLWKPYRFGWSERLATAPPWQTSSPIIPR